MSFFAKTSACGGFLHEIMRLALCGRRSMAGLLLPKQITWVRFPSPAPDFLFLKQRLITIFVFLGEFLGSFVRSRTSASPARYSLTVVRPPGIDVQKHLQKMLHLIGRIGRRGYCHEQHRRMGVGAWDWAGGSEFPAPCPWARRSDCESASRLRRNPHASDWQRPFVHPRAQPGSGCRRPGCRYATSGSVPSAFAMYPGPGMLISIQK